jgi:hypothetical protein
VGTAVIALRSWNILQRRQPERLRDVKPKPPGSDAYGVGTGGNGGLELLIFDRRKASDHATNHACSRALDH